tara:strand:+ start:830 stop:1930 length:1101 start_codon:yes stop_codon:yes gene_type:complete
MKNQTKTRHAGVYRLDDGRFLILATAGKGGSKRKKRTMPSGTTLSEAAAARAELLADLKAPEGMTERIGLGEWILSWLAEQKLRPSTLARYRGALLDHILPELGRLAIEDISRSTVQKWCLSVSEKRRSNGEHYAHQTVLGWWRICKQLLQDAAAEFDLPDPTRRVRPPSTSVAAVRRRDALTREQLATYLEVVREVRPQWYPEIYTLAHTGMRPGELYALTWGDVDFEAGWIHIRRAVWREHVDQTKTGAERRAPLTDGLASVLRTMPRGLPAALLFPAGNGRHRLPQSLKTTLDRLSKRYDLPRVTPYTFRYTFRTLMRDSGAPDEMVRAIQGHADPRMGINYYRVDMGLAAAAVSSIGIPPGI